MIPLRYLEIAYSRALVIITSALLCFRIVAAQAETLSLARQLFDEEDFRGARREALRGGTQEEMDAAVAALAAVRLFPLESERRQIAGSLIKSSMSRDVAAWTSVELGRILWESDDLETAACLIQGAFAQAEDHDLFLQSAYLLRVLALRYPHRVSISDAIRTQVMTVYPRITPAIQQAASPPRRQQGPRLSARLARGGVRLYQTQISPALGQRCSMHPSCSAYCLQAMQQYGVVGIPMTADRLIRETDHVHHRIHPIWVDGVEKFYDPVEAHSFWFRRYR